MVLGLVLELVADMKAVVAGSPAADRVGRTLELEMGATGVDPAWDNREVVIGDSPGLAGHNLKFILYENYPL